MADLLPLVTVMLGHVTPREVRLLRFPAGELSCFVIVLMELLRKHRKRKKIQMFKGCNFLFQLRKDFRTRSVLINSNEPFRFFTMSKSDRK